MSEFEFNTNGDGCVNSGFNINDHFADAGKMVTIGSNATREIDDVKWNFRNDIG